MLPTRFLAVALAAVCLVTVAGCGKKPVPPPPEEGNYYVALGDSFTAVAGTGPFTDALCRRTDDNYPSLVQKKMHFATFEDASCGGAAPSDLAGAQKIPGQGVNQPQLNAVSEDTKLVTVGVGLNYKQLSYYLLEACVPDHGQQSEDCTNYLSLPVADLPKLIDQIGEQVALALRQVRERAPEARIILVGYPRAVPDVGGCPKRLPLAPVVLDRTRNAFRLADKVLEAAAAQEKADYIDMYASRSHDICSKSPWVNGAKEIKGEALKFHPFESYHRAVAAKIVALLEKTKPQA